MTIGCEPGYVINLIRANYGRFSITICNDQGNVDWSVNCMSAKSLRVLYAKCSHKQNCSILASTNTFGDPCPGTHKYLEAHYQCVSGKDFQFFISLFLCFSIALAVYLYSFRLLIGHLLITIHSVTSHINNDSPEPSMVDNITAKRLGNINHTLSNNSSYTRPEFNVYS